MVRRIVALAALAVVAGCGDGMTAADAARSVMAQSYVCGLLEGQGRPSPNCATPKRYVDEIGIDTVLWRIESRD